MCVCDVLDMCECVFLADDTSQLQEQVNGQERRVWESSIETEEEEDEEGKGEQAKEQSKFIAYKLAQLLMARLATTSWLLAAAVVIC